MKVFVYKNVGLDLPSFDEMLKMSAKGNNTAVDMLVGDIYGGNDYSKVGLAATTIASSFGKVVMDDSSSVADYKPEDIALSLLRMISYNIAQVRSVYGALGLVPWFTVERYFWQYSTMRAACSVEDG